jgi:hypothetical protein
MTIRLPSRNRRGMLRLAYPGRLRAILAHGTTRHDLVDLSQEGARIAVRDDSAPYQVGTLCDVVLYLVSRAVLAAQVEVARVSPGDVAFRFRDVHFPFTLMLEEHCAVLTGQDQAGRDWPAVTPDPDPVYCR